MGCPIFEAPWLVWGKERQNRLAKWWGRPLKWLRKQMFILSWIIWIIKDSFGTIINVRLCYYCSHFSFFFSVTKYFHTIFWGERPNPIKMIPELIMVFHFDFFGQNRFFFDDWISNFFLWPKYQKKIISWCVADHLNSFFKVFLSGGNTL